MSVSDSSRTINRLAAPGGAGEPAPAGKVVRLRPADADGALVSALINDPATGRALLFDRYGADVERILYRILGADPDVYDLLHDVFVAALTSVGKLRDPNAIGGWLTGIAVNKARKLIRKRRRWRWIQFVSPFDLPDSIAPTPSADVSEALAQTYRILGELPTEDRIAFALRNIEGMQLGAIALLTGVSLATTKRRITRAERAFFEQARRVEALEAWVGKGGASR